MTAGPTTDTPDSPDTAFIDSLRQGGETGRLIADHDWSQTSIGPINTWSGPLRTALNLLLRSPVPIVMLWNEDGVMLYNDAYSVFAGGRHPQLLGSKVREGWPEVADFNDNVMKTGLAGGTLQYKDQQLTLHRHGKPEPAWMNLDYSPVLDELGRPAGVIAVVVETTERILAERRAGEERARMQAMLAQMPGFAAILEGPRHVFTYVNEAYSTIAGGRRLLGLGVREAFPELAVQGFYDLLDEVYRTGVPYVGRALPIQLDGVQGKRFIDLLYEPIRDVRGTITGIFVGGYDVTEAQVAAERIGLALDSGAIVGTWVWDIPTGIITGDERFARTFGVETSAMRAGVDVERLLASIHPDDLDYVRPHLEATLATGGLYSIQYRVRKGDGSWMWIEANGRVDMDADGHALRFPGVLIDVDDRRRAELSLEGARGRLAVSEESLRLATEAAEIGTWDLDLTTDVLTWSDRTKAMFGISPNVVCSMADFYAGLHPDDREATGIAFASALDPEVRAVYDVEYRTIGKEDGVVRWVAAKGKGLFDPAGTCVRAMGTAIEITARKATEAALAELNASLERQVAEQLAERDRLWTLSQDPFLIADAAGVWLRVSPAWTHILGWTEDELLGRTSDWMSHPDDLQKTRNEIVGLAHGHRTLRFENRFRTRDGDYRIFSWTAVEEDGLLYCTARDVTEIRARDRALRDSQDFTRLALGAVGGIGIWNYDVASDRFFFDEGIAEFYALDPASGPKGLLREDFLGNVHPDDMAGLRTTMSGGLVVSGDLELEYRIVHPDGSVRWLLSRGNTYFDETGQPIRRTGVGIDITEKRRLEEQLRQSQKMEAVGQLTGGIAHDFNNMLAVVMGSLELLARRLGDGDPRARHYVQAAADASRRAANLTQRLLVFSRQQPLKPESIDANRLVVGMSDLLRHSIGADVRLETVLAAGTWRTEVDPNQLESVILNLGVNARDAMPDGGRLTIETQNVHLDARYVANEPGVPSGQYVMIAVSDTGAGMTPEVLAKAFDPFFTTKEPGKGTGLGLSQVYGFVKSSGGHIKIYSEPGQGTTVKIYLPRVETPSSQTDLHQESRGPLPGDAHELILVVDDEDAVRSFAVEALTELGYHVLEASNARVALELLAARPEIVLMLTDVVMPDVNGRKLTDQAMVMRPDLKVLYMTGYTRNAVVHNGVLDKGVHMIGKPFTLDELAARVRGLLDGV